MLTKGDEYPIHQTPEPVAVAGSDRNFYDRYFFNGYNADGSVFFAAAMGIYPHLNIIDGAFSILRDGKQSSVFMSKCLGMERMDTSVGPLSVEVTKPLERIHLRLTETEGIAAELAFTGRAFPIEEPRFIHRQGPRMVIDCTRMTQNGHWAGMIRIDGHTIELTEGKWHGTRDRSWGVRPIGAMDPQPALPIQLPQYYWVWTPLNFKDCSVFYHINDDAAGRSWNTRGVIVPDGASAGEQAHLADCSSKLSFAPGTRRATSASITFTDHEGRGSGVEVTPFAQFQMKGVGYRHEKWTHGAFISEELSFAREDWSPADLPWQDPHNLHIQAISKAVLTDENGARHEGIGTFEQLFVGPHAPSGFKEILDGAA